MRAQHASRPPQLITCIEIKVAGAIDAIRGSELAGGKAPHAVAATKTAASWTVSGSGDSACESFCHVGVVPIDRRGRPSRRRRRTRSSHRRPLPLPSRIMISQKAPRSAAAEEATTTPAKGAVLPLAHDGGDFTPAPATRGGEVPEAKDGDDDEDDLPIVRLHSVSSLTEPPSTDSRRDGSVSPAASSCTPATARRKRAATCPATPRMRTRRRRQPRKTGMTRTLP